MLRRFVSSRTSYGGDAQTPQVVTLSFPYPERVEVYTLTSNATKWDLQGSNDGSTWTTVDSESVQQKLYPSYTCSNPGSYSQYRFVVYQVRVGSGLLSDSKRLYISSMKLTNQFRQTLHPNLTQQSKTYTCVLDGPSPLTLTEAWYNTSGTTTVINGPTYNFGYAQSNIGANVVCAHIRYASTPATDRIALVGSINGGRTWTNVLALNTTVSSNLTPFNSFRITGTNGNVSFTRFDIYDPAGNLVNRFPAPTNAELGGAYRGAAVTAGVPGEWIDMVFDQPVAANVYEFSNVNASSRFPSAWTVLGGNTPVSNWSVLHSVSNVYDWPTGKRYTSPFNQNGLVPYDTYRFIVSAYQGRSSAEVVNFKIYDDRGLELIPRSSTVRITSNLVQLPSNPLGPYNTAPFNSSPFIEGQVFVSQNLNGQFSIELPVAVSIHKVYADTDSTFQVVGDQTSTFPNPSTILTVNSLVPSNTYRTTDTRPYRYIRFQQIGRNKYMSNVALFNRDGNRINPFLTKTGDTVSVSSNVYGGRGQSDIVIQLNTPNVYANAYAFLVDQPFASWTLESNVSGTWQTVESFSNVYTSKPYYQNTFTNRFTTGMRLTVKELAPHKTETFTASVKNLSILGNVYTPAVPSLTQNTFTVNRPGPISTNSPGEYKIRSSQNDLIYRLFDDNPDTETNMTINPDQTVFYTSINGTDVYGDFFEVETPFPASLRYFTFTTAGDSLRTPTSWKFVGSQDRGATWSNVLSEQTSYFSTMSPPSQNTTYVFPVSNTTASFTNFRFVITQMHQSGITTCKLKQFSLFSNVSRVVPKFTRLDEESNYYAWSTLTDVFGGAYQGPASTNIYTVVGTMSNVIPGEWIQLAFPRTVSPSSLRLTGNILPTTMYVVASETPFRTTPATTTSELSYIVGNVQYNFTQTRTITIPLTMPRPMQYYRIIGSEMFSNSSPQCGSLTFSEISFLNNRSNKIHRDFTTSDQTDPLNQSYTVQTSGQFGGEYQNVPEFVEANLFPNYQSSNSYILRTFDAKRWSVQGSNDYSTWYTLDTREIDEQITNIIPRAYQFNYSSNSTNAYTWYRLVVTHTFPTTDGRTRITEFSPLDYKRDRLLKFATSPTEFSNAYSGGRYNGFSYLQTSAKNYYGEYKIFTYDRPTTVSNVNLSYPSTTSIKGITFLGRNNEPFWNVIPISGETYDDEISNVSDSTLTGTYIFSGTTISAPSNAFTTSSVCFFADRILNREVEDPKPYVQIELPDQSLIDAYEISIPSQGDVGDFSLPAGWVLSGSINGSTWATVNEVPNDTKLIYNSSLRYSAPTSVPYKYYRFTITRVNGSTPITAIKQLTLFYRSRPLYRPNIFTRGKNIQLVESAPLYKGPNKIFEFAKPVTYSNIAFVVSNFSGDPYAFDGRLAISGTPDKFIIGNDNYSKNYSYKPTDIVSGNAQSIVFYNDSSRYIKPSRYTFTSRTAQSWSLFGSQDGKTWSDLGQSPIKNPTPCSWLKLTVDKITNLTDGTLDISQFKIYEDGTPVITWPPDTMKGPSLISNSILQVDSFGIVLGTQIVRTST